MLKIKRALISVSDKQGLEEFAKVLHDFNVEIVSTGGTAKLIKAAGIPVRLVSEFTGSPEMLDGRVKTLHPKLHGGLLAVRSNKDHMSQVENNGIELIDMVIVNLYPFEKTVSDVSVKLEAAIENIDIGGPSMLRSAAKNYKSVAVICDPRKYVQVIDEMKKSKGALSEQTCFSLAIDVFSRTHEYDRAIVNYLRVLDGENKTKADGLQNNLGLSFTKVQDLRYGENPHQMAAFYKDTASFVPGISNARQLHGKELSFNNILDLDAALNIVKDFKQPAAAIIKHSNPCGAATAVDITPAYKDALDCDPMSAFGSIVGLNRHVEVDTAQAVLSADFVECIIAPGFSEAALKILVKKKNIRIMDAGDFVSQDSSCFSEWDYKRINAGLLMQKKDLALLDQKALKVVTSIKPTKEQMNSLLFAWGIVKHVKSNAIVLANGTKTVGVGAGQMSRVDSVIISIRKAAARSKGAVLASDAFFPKADGVLAGAEAGIKAIIQPGGSIRDQEVIDAAERANIAMVLTGVRHFKH